MADGDGGAAERGAWKVLRVRDVQADAAGSIAGAHGAQCGLFDKLCNINKHKAGPPFRCGAGGRRRRRMPWAQTDAPVTDESHISYMYCIPVSPCRL
ncbi:hypothetical protein EVAR_60926_1 [Eumeta japonica]|uniref:Uncharacterized protein n=1 Tax=Eumeta variegata TaxID=151549 RepID=A0A4C1ZIK0_EUMVA|nr:hypothetical protein EVAR_60926_1 [Eumeta japonica]